MLRKKGKLIVIVSVIVFLVVISIIVILPNTRRDCPLTDVKLGMAFDKTISLLDKNAIIYEVFEGNAFKTISYDESLEGIIGTLYLDSDIEKSKSSIIDEISWIKTVETNSSDKEAGEIIKNYLSKLYGTPKEDSRISKNGIQCFYWFNKGNKITFYLIEYDNSSRIQVSWGDKQYYKKYLSLYP